MLSDEPATALNTVEDTPPVSDGIAPLFDLGPPALPVRVTSRREKVEVNSALHPPAHSPIRRSYGSDEPWEERITDEDIVRMLKGEGLAVAISELWARAVGGKPPEIHDDIGGALAEEISVLLDRLDFWAKWQHAYKQKRDRGLALISLGYADGAEGDGLAEPVADRVGDIEFIHVITRDMVKEIVEGTDPFAEDYGQILEYKLEYPEGASKNKKEFIHHASRYMHWVHPSPDNDPYGMSQFVPMWNILRGMYRMDNAMFTTIRRLASKIPFYNYPKGTPGTTLDAVETALKKLDANSVVGFSEGWNFDLKGTADALDPEPYTSYFIAKFCAMSAGNKVVVMGPEEGKLASAELSERMFYTRAADEQRNDYGVMARKFIDLMRLKGVIKNKTGRYWLEFQPIREDDAGTKATIAKTEAEALKISVETIATATGKMWEATTDADGRIMLTLEGGGIELEVPGINSAEVNQEDEDAMATTPGMAKLSKQERARLSAKMYGDWEMPTAEAEGDLLEVWMRHWGKLRKAILAWIDDNWDKSGLPREKVSVNDARIYYEVNDEAEFRRAWDEFTPSSAEFEREVAAGVEGAYRAGLNSTEERMGWGVTEGSLDDIEGARAMEEGGREMARGTLVEGKRVAGDAITEGFRAGKSYSQMTDDVAKAMGKGASKHPQTVQKLAHEASCRARWDALRARGQDMATYWTALDDRVRDSHARLHGQVLTQAEAMGPLSEFGCRCTIAPLSEYDKAVAGIAWRGT